MISLDRVKQQLRLDSDHDAEDELLNVYIKASLSLIENHTRRRLVTDSDRKDSDDQLVFSDDVELAALLVISHWYANRESVAIGLSVAAMPLAFDALLQPYVRYGV
ncbi:TPA: head-tail connector protein [Providencia alcalifaciens]